MTAILDLLYLLNFTSIIILYLGTVFIIAIILILLKKSYKKSFSISIILTFFAYIGILVGPLPPPLESKLKNALNQQVVYGVGSNGLVNTILRPCAEDGYLRGVYYRKAIYWENKDMENHLNRKDTFKLTPINKDFKLKDISLCEFANIINDIKIEENL